MQTFTCPAWTLLCLPLYALTKSPYAALMVSGLLCSGALCWLIHREFRARPFMGACVFLTLTASPSFLAFSTSGLENSLAHLLVVAFAISWLKQHGRLTVDAGLMGGLFLLTRLDYALVLLPPALFSLLKGRGSALVRALPGLLLVAAWELFALVYYGSLLPNTAYAKLNTTVPWGMKFAHGLAYAVDAAFRDPAMMLVLGLSWLIFLRRGMNLRHRTLLFGAILYFGYVFLIGGDFMAGRFYTVPLVLTSIVLFRRPRFNSLSAGLLSVFLAYAAFFSWQSRITDVTHTECYIGPAGIADERPCYMEHTGLAQNINSSKWKTHSYLDAFVQVVKRHAKDGVVVFHLVGIAGFADTPEVHVVEPWSLTEPLLARIRFRADAHTRPGHFTRAVPAGYVESLRSGRNQIENRCISALYERVRLATTGPLFTKNRWAAIWQLHTTGGSCPAP